MGWGRERRGGRGGGPMDVASIHVRVNMNEEEEEACAYGPK